MFQCMSIKKVFLKSKNRNSHIHFQEIGAAISTATQIAEYQFAISTLVRKKMKILAASL